MLLGPERGRPEDEGVNGEEAKAPPPAEPVRERPSNPGENIREAEDSWDAPVPNPSSTADVLGLFNVLADDFDDEPPPSSTLIRPPVVLAPRGERAAPLVFKQGAHPPFGIRWYGVTSLFGHLRNFVARAIATEAVDSRDWMRPNRPEQLVSHAARVLAPRGGWSSNAPAGKKTPASLVEALGRPLWIDFVADTGDDRDVSARVGAMLSGTYDADDGHGGRMLLPRGDMLIFGGDIAYPVATADEIYKRVILPWNEELRRAGASTKRRVLLGAPGNHDWYDGLDGFGRLFRRRLDEPFRADDRDTMPKLGKRLRDRAGRKVGLVARAAHLDEVGALPGLALHFVRSVRAFFGGRSIKRRRRLVLRGYEPLQEASYFAMPLAPGLDLWGADRQLGRIDFRQRTYFTKRRQQEPNKAVLYIAGDPAMAYGLRNDPGARMLAACRLSLERDKVFFLAGDFHHYERRAVGKSMHVIAGGGGAFLHGTRVSPYPEPAGPPAAVYPDAAASRALGVQVPLKLMIGRAGYLVHVALALVASLVTTMAQHGTSALVATTVLLSLALVPLMYGVAHQGHGPRSTRFLFAIPFAVLLGMLPALLVLLAPHASFYVTDAAVIIVYAFAGAFVFGVYLTALLLLGLEHQQAFTVLGHPGFKHFVRLCVHPDGKIEGWTIGKDDMLAPGDPHLVDRFEWDPTK